MRKQHAHWSLSNSGSDRLQTLQCLRRLRHGRQAPRCAEGPEINDVIRPVAAVADKRDEPFGRLRKSGNDVPRPHRTQRVAFIR